MRSERSHFLLGDKVPNFIASFVRKPILSGLGNLLNPFSLSRANRPSFCGDSFLAFDRLFERLRNQLNSDDSSMLPTPFALIPYAIGIGHLSIPSVIADLSKTAFISMKEILIPYITLLSAADSDSFAELRLLLASPVHRYHRNKRVEIAMAALLLIRRFCIRNAEDDWRRCLVSGICWLEPETIAVNSRHLGHLLGRSKSSTNGVLALMKYAAQEMTDDSIRRLCRAIPYLAQNPRELRQWTLRKLVLDAPQNEDVLPQEHQANEDQPKAVEGIDVGWDGWDPDFFC
jgi:hypothetical protein